mgnify:FL=1
MSSLRQAAPPVIQAVGWLPSPEKENKIEETLEQLRQDRDAYKQAYENMCVFYKQLVLAKQRLTASYEAVEHSVQADEKPCPFDHKELFQTGTDVCPECNEVTAFHR